MLKLLRYQVPGEGPTWGLLDGQGVTPLATDSGSGGGFLASLLQLSNPVSVLKSLGRAQGESFPFSSFASRTRRASRTLLAPIDLQEVWAAGVTYLRSKVARMEESEGAARFYDMVYDAERPELFLKATPHRVVGPGAQVLIRQDARWNVPEPELGLLLSPAMRIVGYTLGNDMSSRDIEGENPLYLPQAKVYRASCALGPVVLLEEDPSDHREFDLRLVIRRDGHEIFSGETSTGKMKRRFADLVSWLARDNTFPHGVYLLTGTGLVPGDDFTLEPGDEVSISSPEIGTLWNQVGRCSAPAEAGGARATAG